MIKRKKTTTANIGPVKIGSGHPIAIQSMTKVDTTDVSRCLAQIKRLKEAGCDIVRVALPTRDDTIAFAKLVQKAGLPLIADIHFSPQRAIEAIEAGAAKIRLNPGNIKNRSDIIRIIDSAKMHKIAVRIGINEASIRDLKKQDIPEAKRVAFMLRQMAGYIKLFESRKFSNLVLSVKSADPLRTIEINRAISENFHYPIHLGLTHAGLPSEAAIPSAVTLGTLLAEGIGDTIRISIAGEPEKEVELAKQILLALGLYEQTEPKLIVCPTCGRCKINVVQLAEKVRKALSGIHKPLKIAVMGCIVNGPGESADADIAITAAEGKGFLYKNGQKIATVPADKLVQSLVNELLKL